MTEVYWLEQTEADVPARNDWLSENEAARLGSLRFAKRRRDWRLGRWTAKLAMAAYRNLPGDSQTLRDVEIRPALSGAPEVVFAGQPAPVTISLSHCDGIAVCAVAPSSVTLGSIRTRTLCGPDRTGIISDKLPCTESVGIKPNLFFVDPVTLPE